MCKEDFLYKNLPLYHFQSKLWILPWKLLCHDFNEKFACKLDINLLLYMGVWKENTLLINQPHTIFFHCNLTDLSHCCTTYWATCFPLACSAPRLVWPNHVSTQWVNKQKYMSKKVCKTGPEAPHPEPPWTSTTLHPPMVSPSGPLVAQIDCSNGWKSLKQKPSFLEGRSISSQVLSRTVPTQWLLCGGMKLVKESKM